MEDFERSPELELLEQQLAARHTAGPSADLRRRVMADVRAELRVPASAPIQDESVGNGTSPTWAFAAAVAVVIALWFNLSLSATQATDYGLRIDDIRPSGDGMIHRIPTEDEWGFPVGGAYAADSAEEDE